MEGSIYLIRHGVTTKNKEDVMQGSLDAPLDDEGREQAHMAAAALAKVKLDYIYHSDLIRAKETAAAIAKLQPEAQLREDARFREIDSGILEGLTFTECWEKYPDLMRTLQTNPWLYRSPEGETSEDVFKRAKEAVLDLIEDTEGKNVAIVTHGFLLSTLMPWFEGESPENMTSEIYLNCSITEIHYDGFKDDLRFDIIRRNDYRHLYRNTIAL